MEADYLQNLDNFSPFVYKRRKKRWLKEEKKQRRKKQRRKGKPQGRGKDKDLCFRPSRFDVKEVTKPLEWFGFNLISIFYFFLYKFIKPPASKSQDIFLIYQCGLQIASRFRGVIYVNIF